MNRSETATMGGLAAENQGKQLDVLVVKEQVLVPVATLSVTALAMENPEDINDMFDKVDDTEKYDVLTLARKSPNLSTFVKLLEQANLADDIQRVEHVTLFAPTNEAFARMPKDKLKTLLSSENTALLSTMLQSHIIASDVSSGALRDNSRIRVTDNSYIPIGQPGTSGTNVTVGGAELVKSDIEAANGRIHVIDKVLLPSEDFQSGNTR
ncbi:hypothetical protein AAE02nite_14090 [Adhaeribacter aerolatus]|uniref:FAS1 domain-containing protein n=2 Tax=Adhaeribacter aerolatus TaxID=670289 RepID=A0A512AVK9_9BACT|nr:hypothetical protein AAE02nite_14090 [Adhaeribacter aerolatus]